MASENNYPYLSLKRVAVDPLLARRLPRRVAYYYLALPLAEDDNEITVVMAYPDNPNVVTVLQTLLGAHIVPVQGELREIKDTLDLLWAEDTDAATPRILCWSAEPEQTALAIDYAGLMSKALSAEAACLDASQNSLETTLTLAREGRYSLTVVAALRGQALTLLLRESATPVLLVRGAYRVPRHILLVLRAGSPDESALDWVIPLANSLGAQITLLAVTPPTGQRAVRSLAALLQPETGAGAHIADCANRVKSAGLEGRLKLRQGKAETEIVEEAAQGDYDLIAIAAEARGDFVQRVLQALEAHSPNDERPVLVIKPITV